jgi:YVTN family beta-propeller protein
MIVLSLVLFACGDNADRPDARQGIDAAIPDAHVVAPRAVAVAGDFNMTGTVSKLEITDLMMRQNVVTGAAQGDPVLRAFGDRVYVVNRFGSNNVTILDGKTLTVVDQISTGANSNPQDVAVVGANLYVPAMGTAGVVVLTPGMPTPKVIDLATPLGDTDGKPDCVSAYTVGTYVYVACGLLDSTFSSTMGKIAVIDTATDTVVGQVVTPYKNPLGFFARAPLAATYLGDLLIPLAPDFSNLTAGCVARISTVNPAAPTAACGPTNAELGGIANRLAVDNESNKLYIAVAESFTVGKLRMIDLATGTLASGALSAANQLIIDVQVCPGGDVVVSDQTTNATGLRVYRGSQERTTEAISIGMNPTTSALGCYDP